MANSQALPGGAETGRRGAVLAAVAVGTLLSSLAGSVVNLALPALGTDLGITLEDSRWVVQSFLLATGVCLLAAGRLGDMWGHRPVYLFGLGLFGLASLGAGLATRLDVLLVARAVQGVAGAATMAVGPAILTTTFPAGQRGRVLGLVSTATYVGLTLGPPLGGFLVATLGWRWCFLLNVPLIGIILAAGLAWLPRAAPRLGARFDWGGAGALLLGLPFLLLALSEGRRWGWGSAWTLGALGAGLAGLAAFVWVERRTRGGLLDLALFRNRLFSGSVLSALANYVALFAVTILMPFYLEEGLGRTPSHTGLLLSVQFAVMALVASPAGWLSDRLGSRLLATLGQLLMAGGLYALGGLGAGAGDAAVAACLGVIGLGTGVFISPNSSALMGAAPAERQGTASSVMAEARVLGMLVGVSLAAAVFSAAGGRTGQPWGVADFSAFRMALAVSAGVAVLGALAAALRGGKAVAAG
ncbi:MAG TPA: MFS transporter [Myxococcota bacterium]|nr:MFS transporter [Myxococcota bacterium]HRY92658.1 MFS transporter [Myxococcota bacterium]HSA23783.1 MFS transporter [Myxococcota bacterium]